MRSIAWLLGIGVVATACSTEDEHVVYAALSYQIRCLEGCEPRVPDLPGHEIKAVDGEGGISLDCRVRDIGGTPRVSFSASFHDPSFSFGIDNGNLEGEESDGPCSVRLVEDNNTYVGACGSDSPTQERPCEITLYVEHNVVKGSVFCNQIPNDANMTSTRWLTLPSTREPATFELHGCKDI
jgi:hypothetical protein